METVWGVGLVVLSFVALWLFLREKERKNQAEVKLRTMRWFAKDLLETRQLRSIILTGLASRAQALEGHFEDQLRFVRGDIPSATFQYGNCDAETEVQRHAQYGKNLENDIRESKAYFWNYYKMAQGVASVLSVPYESLGLGGLADEKVSYKDFLPKPLNPPVHLPEA